MGYFLAVSAFKDVPVDALARAVAEDAARYQVWTDATLPRTEEVAPRTDATLFDPVNGWTIILWPEYFNAHDFGACKRITAGLGCLASTVHVHDDDYWAHGLFERGDLLDRFCSQPGYFTESAEEEQRLK